MHGYLLKNYLVNPSQSIHWFSYDSPYSEMRGVLLSLYSIYHMFVCVAVHSVRQSVPLSGRFIFLFLEIRLKPLKLYQFVPLVLNFVQVYINEYLQ